jgi:hypothetical protein
MKTLITLLGSLALATTVVAAQAQQQAPPTPPQAQQEQTEKPDVSLTGCLVQGSGPNVFILESARMDPEDAAEKAKAYVVVAATEDLFLRTHLDNQVTIRGAAEDKMVPTPPAGEQVSEADLPKLNAKGITAVADTCTPAR